MQKNTITILIVIATVVLAGIAVFTAIRLYGLRQEPVALNNPTSEPAATQLQTPSPTPTHTPPSCSLSFTLSTKTNSPTPTSSPSIGGVATPTATPVATKTPIPTPTPAALPDAGTSFPTFLGIGIGAVLIVLAFKLAL